jgi:hypothetical protein
VVALSSSKYRRPAEVTEWYGSDSDRVPSSDPIIAVGLPEALPLPVLTHLQVC